MYFFASMIKKGYVATHKNKSFKYRVLLKNKIKVNIKIKEFMLKLYV